MSLSWGSAVGAGVVFKDGADVCAVGAGVGVKDGARVCGKVRSSAGLGEVSWFLATMRHALPTSRRQQSLRRPMTFPRCRTDDGHSNGPAPPRTTIIVVPVRPCCGSSSPFIGTCRFKKSFNKCDATSGPVEQARNDRLGSVGGSRARLPAAWAERAVHGAPATRHCTYHLRDRRATGSEPGCARRARSAACARQLHRASGGSAPPWLRFVATGASLLARRRFE